MGCDAHVWLGVGIDLGDEKSLTNIIEEKFIERTVIENPDYEPAHWSCEHVDEKYSRKHCAECGIKVEKIEENETTIQAYKYKDFVKLEMKNFETMSDAVDNFLECVSTSGEIFINGYKLEFIRAEYTHELRTDQYFIHMLKNGGVNRPDYQARSEIVDAAFLEKINQFRKAMTAIGIHPQLPIVFRGISQMY